MKSNLIIVFFFLTNFLYSQNFEIQWQQCFGGTNNDDTYDIISVEDGYLIGGGSKSNDGDISFNHGATDCWLIKTDKLGEIEWEKTYGGSYGDGIFRIFPTNDNNYYLLCSSYSSDGDISNDPYPESTDFWIVKIDSFGNIIWERIVGGNGGDQMWTGTTTNDGGVVALGWSGSEYGDVSVNYGLDDMWMIKLSSDGEIEWDFTLGTDWQDYGQAIIQTSDGGFLVGGASKLTGGGNLDCECNGQADGILIKLDTERNIEWQKCYGGSDYDGITSLIEINNGYIFSAFINSNGGDILGWHGEHDVWIVKVDFNGNIIWQNAIGGSKSEATSNIFQNSNNDIISFASTQSHDGDVSGNHSLSEYDHDIWMVKLNNEGELLSQQCIGGLANEQVNFGVIQKSEYNYVIAGQTDYGPSDDVQCDPHGTINSDFWVFEIKDTTVGISQTPQNETLKVYPNPANNYVVFETENTKGVAGNTGIKQSHTITITNTYGQQIAQLQVKDNKTVWDTRSINSGVYFYSLMIAGEFNSGKVIVQH
jgi:hypothetical protein